MLTQNIFGVFYSVIFCQGNFTDMNLKFTLGKTTGEKWIILFISIGLGIALSYIALLCQGYSLIQLESSFQNPSPHDGLALGWANAWQQVGIFGFSTWILSRFLPPIPLAHFQKKTYLFGAAFLTLIWLILSMGFIEWIGLINLKMMAWFPTLQNWAHLQEIKSLKIQTALLNNQGFTGLSQVIFLMSIVPGIFEELFFRSFILRWQLLNQKPIWAIAFNGLIFSFIHFQFEGFFARWILGMMLGYVYLKSGRIWVGILLHILNNLLGVLIYTQLTNQMSFSPDHWIYQTWVMIASGIIFIAGWKGIDYLWRPKGILS